MSVHKLFQMFILTTFIAPLCMARESSVELEDGTILSGVTTVEKQLPDSSLSVFGIIVGRSKLSEVSERFQGNSIYHEGDAGKSLYLLCYRGNDGTVVAFESGGEMGGAEHVVTNIAVFGPKAHYCLSEKCGISPKINKAVKIGGIRLGMTKDKVKKANGKFSKEQGDLALYSYHSLRQTPRGPVEVTSILQIQFSGKNVSQFSISKIKSY